jgi:hypothetical protein
MDKTIKLRVKKEIDNVVSLVPLSSKTQLEKATP